MIPGRRVNINEELKQERVVVTLLELILENGDFKKAQSILNSLLKKQGQFVDFRLVGIDSVSDLLTTFVRAFSIRLKRRTTDEVIELFGTIVGFSKWGVDYFFNAIIAKLEGVEVAISLGLHLCIQEHLDEE